MILVLSQLACHKSAGLRPKVLGQWIATSASVIGQSHVKRDKPCQDYSATRLTHDEAGKEILLVAVSDGAGSAKFSEYGSRLVCDTFLALALHRLDHKPDALWSPQFFRDWHEFCLKNIDREAKQRGAQRADLAATALFAVLSVERSMFFQIGDGAIVVSDDPRSAKHKTFSWVFWPDKGEEYANLTKFVTSKDAWDWAEGCICDLAVSHVAAFTDGIENVALVDQSQSVQGPLFSKFYGHVGTASNEIEREGKIRQILNSPNLAKKSDDDKSLALAVR